jgi:CDP-glycerol glycerophosphotransferase (TagB/SpsB family)
MIGKPKLDYLKIKISENKRIFKNENPIFYYNPHWEMELSSYLKWKDIILKFFKENNNYNLIFSPHPLVRHLSIKIGYEIKEKNIVEDNILVDMGSNQCLDGTYTSIADIYIGDISSMVTEWVLQKPRPCIFINAHNVDWKDNDNYYMWKFGKVVNTLKEFEESIIDTTSHNQYEKIQKKLKNEFIYTADKSSSDLVAEFITKKVCHT